MKLSTLVRDRRGQGMVEYALLVAGVALVCVVAVSMMGHKTGDMIGTTAAVLPGAHSDDNGLIQGGQVVETARAADGTVQIDLNSVKSQDRSTQGNLFGAANDNSTALVK